MNISVSYFFSCTLSIILHMNMNFCSHLQTLTKKERKKRLFARFSRSFSSFLLYYLFLIAELYRCDIISLLEESVEMLYILVSNGQCNIFNGHAAAL